MLRKYYLFNILFIVKILFVLKTGDAFASQDYSIQPPEPWVEKVSADDTAAIPDESLWYGLHMSLVDLQTKVGEEKTLYYCHYTEKVLNQTGITNSANFKITYHPATDHVILHHVTIRRNGQVINQLNPKHIKILQREEKLTSNLFTGRKSLYIFLQDLRIGDSIDYSYTIVCSSKERLKNFYYNVDLQRFLSIGRGRDRILWPKNHPIAIKNQRTKVKPSIKDQGDHTEYIWEYHNISMINLEEKTPDWFHASPLVEVRSKRSWHSIATEDAALYQMPKILSRELNAYIQQIAQNHTKPSEQFITVMRFIQDDIRYMSVNEVNQSIPADPSSVFQRRYGDCKDKSLLAVTILRKLGIQAYPAYVQTSGGESLPKSLPSASAFNHVIVVAYINGQKYWIDATQSFQRGSLDHYIQPDFGYALILNTKTKALVKMPTLSFTEPTKSIYENFDLRQGHHAPAKVSIKTILRKNAADNFREYAVTTPRKKIQQYSLDFYRQYYPSIVLTDKEIMIIDDPELNEMTILEEYEIPHVWTRNDQKKRWEFPYYAQEIESHLTHQDLSQRTSPLALNHPIFVEKNIVMQVSGDHWAPLTDNKEVSSPEFHFTCNNAYENNIFSAVYTFKSLKDHLNPKHFDAYNQRIKDAKEMTSWILSDHDTNQSKDHVNWPILLLLGLCGLFFICFLGSFYFYKFKKPLSTLPETPYKGIGGWLLIIVIGFFIGLYLLSTKLYCNIEKIYFLHQWAELIDPAITPFNPLQSLFIIKNIVLKLFMCIAYCVLIIMCLKHKRIFPIFCMLLAWTFTSLFLIILIIKCIVCLYKDINMFYHIIHPSVNFVSSLLDTLIITAYLLKSKRVKATFIKP